MLPEFKLLRPRSLEEALGYLSEGKPDIRPIAGGTDIIPGFHLGSGRFKQIQTLVHIGDLPELRRVEQKNGEIHLGACLTFSDILENRLIQKHFPLLVQAASQLGSVQIRNRATLAGNFVNNAPCADSVPPLLVYNASIHIRSASNSRELPLSEFLIQPYKTQLRYDELVTAIVMPIPSPDLKGVFYKLGRRRGVAISRITLAILANIQNGHIREMRIASGAITPVGLRLTALEERARNQPVSTDLFKSLARECGETILNITGLRWSTPYKLPVVQQMLYLLLKDLAAKNGSNVEKE